MLEQREAATQLREAVSRLTGAQAFVALGHLSALALRRGLSVEQLVLEARQVCALARELGLDRR